MAKIIRARWFSILLAVVLITAPAVAQRKKSPRKAASTGSRRSAAKSPARTPAAAGQLARLVRDWRESPTAGKRAAIERYAAAHPKEAALANLALGVGAYEQNDFTGAIGALRKTQGKLPQVADYAAYYLAAARADSDDTDGLARELVPVHATTPPSPLSGKAWLLEGRALQAADPAAGIRILRDHYAEIPQPDGNLALADCYNAAKDFAHAADFYQRIYIRYLSGATADRAAAALVALKDVMGANYPEPLPEQLLARAGRFIDIRDYSRARAEYLALSGRLTGLAGDQARVRVGVSDFRGGNASAAYQYLRGLELPESEADAERLYYLTECARRLSNDDGMMSAVQSLNSRYTASPWRLRALVSAANRFLLVNRPDDFVPLYKAAYEGFPAEPVAGLCHWKVTFQAYLRDQPDAADLLREHLREFPLHPTTGAALYFLGRRAERGGDAGSARAYYQRLSGAYPNHYYGMLARERLARPEVERAAATPAALKFLAEITRPAPEAVPTQPTRETTSRIERSRLLRSAGLADLADGELRFGTRTSGQGALLGMEMASQADATHTAVRIMKNMAPDYLTLKVEQAPRKFWELLFPLPYRDYLVRYARERNLDPFLIAGLIRQESEFNPDARSGANAYGLTQVRPGTGRTFARRLGMRFNNRVLFQPAANLRIGSSIFRSMLDQNGGKVEQTLASYNAGPNRLADWMTWNTYREPAEFVESIPFTETRDYVQAVLRNAEMYRQLYK